MIVRTQNSVYRIVGKGQLIEATKLENEGTKGEVAVGYVLFGTHLTLAIGEDMHLTGVKGSGMRTSKVISIE